mmetsp:Transcript_658/g.1388  ORF Transcript_658/g.1388 Transcript_658/m.1388 type:complete len:662 (-) Transcript_658:212-2197(-)
MKYLEDSRLIQLTSDLTEAFLNTRGSGFSGNLNVANENRNGRGGKSKKQNQKQHQSISSKGGDRQSNNNKASSYSYSYNSAGYSSYGVSTGYSTSSSSCRVIYGRVEAYNTKRAGSDKKTAHEVGERYAHEMERLNEAVKELKRKHHLQNEKESDNIRDLESRDSHSKEGEASNEGEEGITSDEGSKKLSRRRRSRSVDGVTFSKSTSSRIVSTDVIASLPEESVVVAEAVEVSKFKKENPHAASAKRVHSLEGILKPPSSNKRWRATSFDISTGPSTLATRYNDRSKDVSSPETAHQNTFFPSDIFRSASKEGDENTHPLIPQPSLYQSSLGDRGEAATLPTMVPRRLVTDLILTLNASFPDYDFGEARPSDFCTLSVPETMRRINEKLSEFAATTDKGRDFLPRFWSTLDDVVFGLKDAEVYSYSPHGGGGDDDPLGFLTTTLAANNENWFGTKEEDECTMTGTQDDISILPNFRCGADNTDAGVDLKNECNALDLPHHILPQPSFKSNDCAHVTLWTMNYFFVSHHKKRIVLFTCVQTMRTPRSHDEAEEYQGDYEYRENDLVFDEARRSKNIEDMDGHYDLPSMNPMRILHGDDSIMVEEEGENRCAPGKNTGYNADSCDDDDEDENDFDMVDETGPGTLGVTVSPPFPPADRLATT